MHRFAMYGMTVVLFSWIAGCGGDDDSDAAADTDSNTDAGADSGTDTECTSPDNEAQMDWSGGPGLAGPLDSWSNRFLSSNGIAYQSGDSHLSLSVMEHNVGSLGGVNFVYCDDVDSDGDVDVLGTGWSADSVVLWRQEGDSWSEETIVDDYEGAHCVTTADLDGDGIVDLLTAAQGGGDVSWLRGDGEGWTRTVISDSFEGAQEIWAVDLDNDNDLDVLASAYHSNLVCWWRNNGGDPLELSPESIDESFPGPTGVKYGDLNGDGLNDVVAPSYDEGTVTWWSQSDEWTRRDIETNFNGAHSVDVGDIDGDGDLDVVAAAYAISTIAWWKNSGENPPDWTRTNVATGFSGAVRASARDMDGDGDLDIVGTAQHGSDVSWWENTDGIGQSWQEHIVSSAYGGAWPHYVVDVDMNGTMDIVVGGFTNNSVSWFEVDKLMDLGTLESTVVDLSATPCSLSLEWDANVPINSSVNVEYRTSDDSAELGEWSSPLAEPAEITDVSGRFFQYRVSLTPTPDGSASPVFTSISVHGD